MLQKPFVILDLETSGTNPKKDDIIEVAMIRYEKGKEVGRFEGLIKIDYELPKIIPIITGITDKDLQEDGQDKGLVFEEIEEMLDGAYMIAHNIKFDAGFLKANGLKLDVLGFIDTIPLAQILIPGAASYSLESLSDDLKIKHVNRHRAMGDVEATLELFKHLCEKAGELPKSVIQDINDHCARCDWDEGVIFEDIAEGAINKSRQKQNNSCLQDKDEIISVTPISPLDPKNILKEGGILQQFWEEYEPRKQQEQMAEAVMSAFESSYHLICEAPTGVGKSLAYLIPAASIAIKNKSKVVISTNTINLQDQLYEKDIPLLKQIYQHANKNNGVKTALLKGRSHYLCLRRLAQFKKKQRYSSEEITVLVKILVWQATTKIDDCAEIHLTRNEKLIWKFELCSDSKYCTPQKCKPYGECYLHKARKKAEDADIIIVNHALLCADMEREGSLLPEYKYLVIDEAHNFEGASTDAFGLTLKQENFTLPIKLIRGHLLAIKKTYQDTLFSGQMAMDKIDDIFDQIDDLNNAIESLFTVIAYFVNQNVQDSGYVENLLIDQVILGMEEWLNLSTSVDETCARLNFWLIELRKFLDAVTIDDDNSEQDEFVTEIAQEAEILQEQISTLKNFFNDQSTPNEYIKWMASDQSGVVSINLAPYVPGDLLKDRLYENKKSIILTSATLGVSLSDNNTGGPEQHPFTYLRTILSLGEEFEELIIDSPFNFETQTYVMVPNDALPIVAQGSVQQLTPFFESLIKKVKGGMMTLFTSYKMIETLYLNLMEPLKAVGTKLLAQRISGGRNKIMKAYMNNPEHSILFGTASFWEGVDIKGSALSTLVIHKLPFDVPSDPIVKARSQMFNNGFMEYMLPRAILKLRQGFGRLIRSKTDYGVMIILDNRVLTKRYGGLFLEALPENITLEKPTLEEIPGNVEKWLKYSKNL